MTQFFNRKSETATRRRLRSEMPDAEFRLWQKLRSGQIAGARFRRQYSIGPYVVDFCSPRLKVVIEVDGDSHYQEGEQERDASRQHFIESFGFTVMRCTNDDVRHNLEGVLEAIWQRLEETRATNPLTPLRKGGTNVLDIWRKL